MKDAPAGTAMNPPRGKAAARRAMWTLADQGAASLVSLGVGVLAARQLSPAGFGAFGISFTVWIIATGFVRSFVTDPLLIRFSSATTARRGAVQAALGGAALAGLVAATLCGLVAPFAGQAKSSLFALAFGLPGLLLLDARRVAHLAEAQPAAALRLTGGWLVLLLAFAVVTSAAGNDSVVVVIAGWWTTAVAATLVDVRFSGGVPRLRDGARFVVRHVDLGWRYGMDYLLLTGSTYALVFLLAGFHSVSEAGAYRGAQLLVAPIVMLNLAVVSVIVPEGARMRAEHPERLRPVLVASAAALVAVGVAWTAVLAALPPGVGRALLDSTWPAAEALIVPLGLSVALAAATFVGTAGLRALEDPRRGLRARIAHFALNLGLGGGGAVLYGARGAAVGLVAANAMAAVVWGSAVRASLAARAAHDRSAA